MNKQVEIKNGIVISRGIEWTDMTWNPVTGCQHGCRWLMPDGKIAICYAENVAGSKFVESMYPNGFEHHYWHPKRVAEPSRIGEPAKIFVVSMGDLLGSWVPDDQIQFVINEMMKAHWHQFQILTKNAPRLLKFEWPPNAWLGASTPPDHMFGADLSVVSKERMLTKTLNTLAKTGARTKWMSVEPASWECAHIFADNHRLDWAVIGAATNGRTRYLPDPGIIENLLRVFDDQGVQVFFKGNIRGCAAADPWRENFPP